MLRKHQGWMAAGVIIMTLMVGLPAPAALPSGDAPAAGVPMMQTSKIRDFMRITFQWPERTRFRTSADGNRLLIEFEKAANPDFGNMLSQLRPHVSKAELSADKHTVILTFDKPYRTRTFISGNTTGVDLLDLDETPAFEPKKSKPPVFPKEAKEAKPAVPAPAQQKAKPVAPAVSSAKIVKTAEAKIPLPKLKPAVPKKENVKLVTPPAPKETAATEVEPVTPAKSKPEDIKPAAAAEAAPVAEAPALATKAEATPATTSAEAKPEEVKSAEVKPTEAAATTPAPAAETAKPAEAPATVETTAATTPTETKPAVAVAAATTETKTAEAPKPAETKTAEVKPAAPPPPPENKPPVQAVVTAATPPIDASAPAPAATPATRAETKAPATPPAAKRPPGPPGVVQVYADAAKRGFMLHFPWDHRVASAVFVRSGYMWVVFSESPKAYEWQDYFKYQQSELGAPTVMKSGNYSVLRFPMTGKPYIKVSQEPGEFDWHIEFSSIPQRMNEASRTITSSTPPLKPHIIVEALEMADPMNMRDPELGDELVIIPFYKPGKGVAPGRNFVEFSLLQTAQGMAVQKLSDDVRVAMLRNGVKVTTPQGITLSHALPQLEPDLALADAETLFPYKNWKVSNTKELFKTISLAELKISQSHGYTADMARLNLAQLYLSEGMAAEALGLLRNLQTDSPEFYMNQRLAALSGAANFMMYRIREAAHDFAAPELEDVPEIQLWKSVTNDLLGITDLPFNYLNYDTQYISKYPPSFRQRLAIIAADLAISRQEYNDALKIFDSLNRDKQLGPVQKYVDYMIATISAETGQPKAAIDIWKRMSQNYDDRFMRARAEFALTGLLLKQGKITRAQAIDRLDHLRIVWRGDNFELNLLSLLANMYYDDKKYLEALRTWREIVDVFPNLPEATNTAQRMAETFNYLFNEGGSDAMKPLDALTLYYEFQNLRPIGTAGDIMIQHVADKLVQVDLLERAEDFLAHQVRYRLEKEDRSRVGARLALIQLLNHKPQEALETLQITGFGANPPGLQLTRNHLAAQALNATGKYDDALALLDKDESSDANMLRMEAYWNKKDWPRVIALGEQQLGSRDNITEQLTPPESDTLMRLALAYVFENDTVQLQYLRDYFTPLMPSGPKKDMFAFVTRDNPVLDNRNFTSINKEVADVASFLQKYRNDLQEKPLSSLIQ